MHDNELVWDAEPENPITVGYISGMVTYGMPPKDWINKLAPPALVVCGKAYLVNPGAHYFALKCDGTVVVFDDPHLDLRASINMVPAAQLRDFEGFIVSATEKDLRTAKETYTGFLKGINELQIVDSATQ